MLDDSTPYCFLDSEPLSQNESAFLDACLRANVEITYDLFKVIRMYADQPKRFYAALDLLKIYRDRVPDCDLVANLIYFLKEDLAYLNSWSYLRGGTLLSTLSIRNSLFLLWLSYSQDFGAWDSFEDINGSRYIWLSNTSDDKIKFIEAWNSGFTLKYFIDTKYNHGN